MKVELFEDLEIWKEARLLCKLVSVVIRGDEFSKDFRLRDQIKASSGSIMDNIAEGFEREGNKEFIQFLTIAKGSCSECRSQAYRSFDYMYIDQAKLDELINKTVQLSKQISALISYLKSSELKGSKFKH
jgi:four helix bundle protein